MKLFKRIMKGLLHSNENETHSTNSIPLQLRIENQLDQARYQELLWELQSTTSLDQLLSVIHTLADLEKVIRRNNNKDLYAQLRLLQLLKIKVYNHLVKIIYSSK